MRLTLGCSGVLDLAAPSGKPTMMSSQRSGCAKPQCWSDFVPLACAALSLMLPMHQPPCDSSIKWKD